VTGSQSPPQPFITPTLKLSPQRQIVDEEIKTAATAASHYEARDNETPTRPSAVSVATSGRRRANENAE